MEENIEKLSITNFEFEENKSIKFHFLLLDKELENKNIEIKIRDGFFGGAVLFNYKSSFVRNLLYWAGTHIMPYSDTVSFDAFFEDKRIFSKIFKINKRNQIDILEKFPYLLNYYNDPIEKFLIDEVFVDQVYYSELTSINKSDVVVDIGSNVGLFIYYALKNKASKIYSCEPNNNCIKILKKHFDIYPHIFINQYAISDKNEEKNLILLDETVGGNFVSDNEEISWHHRDHQTQKVKGIEFLDFIKINNIDFIDYLKVDCEGGEHYIFTEKNKNYICENVNKIVLEYHGSYQKIINFFEENNFSYQLNILNEHVGMIYAKNKKFLDII